MNLQAVEDWVKKRPLEEGDTCIILVASNEKFGAKVEGTVADIADVLLQAGRKNPDLGLAFCIAASKLIAKLLAKGGEE